MSLELRRRTPEEVAAYLDAHDDRLAEVLPDEGERAAFKAELVQAAARPLALTEDALNARLHAITREPDRDRRARMWEALETDLTGSPGVLP